MAAGLCRYTDVSESRVDLGDLAAMNEILDVREYNDRVMAERARPRPEPSNPFDVFRR